MANPISNNPIFPGGSNFVISGGSFTSNTTHNFNGAKGGFERLLDAVAPNALHNSGHDFDAPKCHPGTRTAVIQAIVDWAAGVHDGPQRKGIAWVTGAAGAGKSAIGRTICERCAKEGTLLASFFFGANDATRNHSRSLVPTLVSQVCRFNPEIRSSVTHIMENDPLILNISLRDQLSSLLIGPLASAYSNETGMPPRVIVIDGLDECHSHTSQIEILDSLRQLSDISPIPIRFLVCSRPESQIVNFFSSPHSQGGLFKIYLGKEYSPNEDIRLFLSDRFTAIKQGHIHRSLIPDTWPETDHMNQLVDNSSGQFIYASTVVYYVESPRHRPHQRLESVLGLRPPFKDLPFAQLDALYAHILEIADEPQLVVDILAISAFHGYVSAHQAEEMLMLEPGDVQILLADCASIVQVPSERMDNMSLLHKSFSDFLCDPHRSKNFHRNYLDTVAKHISRIIEIFLEQQTGRITLFQSTNLCTILASIDISDEAWNTSAFQATLTAVTQFPMASFCKTVFSRNSDHEEPYFLCSFFQLLHKFQLNPAINEAYLHHMQALCQSVFGEINNQYCNDWKGNYALAIFYLQGSYRKVQFDQENDNFYAVLYLFSQYWAHKLNDQVTYTIQQLMQKADKSRILARAAAYCFQYLSNHNSKLEKGPDGFIHIRGISRKIRQTRPWHWHRTFRSRLRTDQLLSKYIWQPLPFTNFKKEANMAKRDNNYRFSVRSIFSANWKNKHPGWYSSLPYDYMCYLEYFIKILPHAEPYVPLINMCKTKTFSQMSTFFPALSRRARRAIVDYLERAESELGNVDAEVK